MRRADLTAIALLAATALVAAAARLALDDGERRGAPPAERTGSAASGADEGGDARLVASPATTEEPASEPAAAAPPSPAEASATAPPEARAPLPPVAAAAEEPPPPLDVVRGRVRARSGAFDDLDRLLAGHLRVELIPLAPDAGAETAEPPEVRVARLSRGTSPSGETWVDFAFAPVPRGAWRLNVSSPDALRIAPARLDLRTPCADVELWAADDLLTLRLGFRVLDAETLEPIDDFEAWSVRTEVTDEAGVLFHAAPLALDAVPVNAPLAWRVSADGYVPASGDERAFQELVDDRWIAEVRLRRGWGRRFVVLARTPTMQPVRGARIELDGELAGVTDADGALEVALAARPARYTSRAGALAAEGDVPGDAEAKRRACISVLVLRE